MSHSIMSDLGLPCLPMSLLWDTRHKWVNPLMPSGFFYLIIWTVPFPVQWESGLLLSLLLLIEIFVFDSNRVDPDQMLHSVGLIRV